ncbi:MAG: glycosyltransferase family A protein [Chloroflexota bacterium]
MENGQCSIVIRAYNEEKHIGRLLSGILKQRNVEPEIILVDSGSTDATRAIASRYPVRVLEIPPEEFSFGRSLNLGCDAAKHEAIVIASAHVYPVYPDWLECLLAALARPRVALAYGKQRGNVSTRFSEHQIFAKWFPEDSNPDQARPFCNNANAVIRKSLWQKRPYDETLPGLEDLDWAAWAMGQGYRVAYVAEAEVIHVHEETLHQVYNRYRREAMALKRIRPEEKFQLSDLVRLFLVNLASDAWHAHHEGGIRGRLAEIIGFRWMQFWGTYRGFRMAGSLTGPLKQAFYYPRGFTRPPTSSRHDVRPIDYGTHTHDL